MNTQQPADGPNSSNNLSCPNCYTQLLPQAVFCSSCGEPVKKMRDWESRTEESEGNAQEQDDDTVRIVSLSQIQLKRWQLSQSLKDTFAPKQPYINSPLTQDAEVPMSPPLVTHIPGTESVDTRVQGEASIPIELSQSLPTTPVPPILETWQPVPNTEVSAPKLPGSNWLWPVIIIISAISGGLVNFVFTDIAIRPIIVFWFLIVCPGMMVVRFLRLKEPVVEWTLAIALSFAIDALVASIQIYIGKWSPAGTLSILIGLSLGGAIVQLAPMDSITIFIPKQLRILHSRKLRVPPAISFARKHDTLWYFVWKHTVEKSATVAVPKRWRSSRAWKHGIVLIFFASLIGLGVLASFWSHVSIHSATSISTVTSYPSRSTPVLTIYPSIAGTYIGTIDDLSSNVSTSLSLREVRQSHEKISGYLILGTRLQARSPFSGTIDTAKHLQFIVTDSTEHVMFFFEGEIQPPTSLSGDYYQCSPNSTQNSQCSRTPGSYGIWSVVLVS